MEGFGYICTPSKSLTLPPVAGDDDYDGDDGKIPARRYSPCSSTNCKLTIDLSSDDDLKPLPIGDDKADGKSDCYPVSPDVVMKDVET